MGLGDPHTLEGSGPFLGCISVREVGSGFGLSDLGAPQHGGQSASLPTPTAQVPSKRAALLLQRGQGPRAPHCPAFTF